MVGESSRVHLVIVCTGPGRRLNNDEINSTRVQTSCRDGNHRPTLGRCRCEGSAAYIGAIGIATAAKALDADGAAGRGAATDSVNPYLSYRLGITGSEPYGTLVTAGE